MVEFAGEAFESVTHADSRVWLTLRLLMTKPGFLTREFLEGRRARYLPPFRLYLVMSVLLFLVIAVVGGKTTIVEVDAEESAAQGSPQSAPQPANETPDDRAGRICDDIDFPGTTREGCEHALREDGNPLAKEMMQNFPKALFVLLPLLALVMQVMYWRRHYVEHLLFFIHNHAFTFAFYGVLIGIAAYTPGWVAAICVLLMLVYPPIYTYRAMRRVFPQNRWLTRLKFLALAFAYFILMSLMGLGTVIYSAATL